MELNAFATKVKALGCLIRSLTLAIVIVPVSLAGTALAVDLNQHGLTGTSYQPALSGQGISPTAHAEGINLHQYGLAGWWYDPRTSGQGFFVQGYPDLLALGKGIVQVSWLTYDDVVGGAEHQRWYTLSGTVVSGQTQVALTIYQNTGGNFNASPITTAQPIGTATLSFDSCTSGELTYNLMGRASTIALTRLMQDELCVDRWPYEDEFWRSGDYYDAATSGQGLTVEVNPLSGMLFFAWMTYAPNGAAAGPAGQRWYTGVGKLQGLFDNPVSVQLYESTGGLFDQGEPVPTTVPVGSATLSFVNNCDVELSFNFTGGSSIGASGTISLSTGDRSGAGLLGLLVHPLRCAESSNLAVLADLEDIRGRVTGATHPYHAHLGPGRRRRWNSVHSRQRSRPSAP